MRRKAFTLIELLVVIAIIALLVTILMPSLNRARELARRSVCKANLQIASRGFAMYGASDTKNDSWPYWTSIGATTATGSNRSTAPWGAAANTHSITSALFMLIRGGQSSGAFICPSSTETPDTDIKDTTNNQYYWDFKDKANVSYSYQMPLTGTPNLTGVRGGTEGRTIVMGDKTAGNDSMVKFDTLTTDDARKKAMSQNHQGEIINVMFVDASVSEFKGIDCGINKDNIYTAANGDPQNIAGTRALADHKKDNDSYLDGPF